MERSYEGRNDRGRWSWGLAALAAFVAIAAAMSGSAGAFGRHGHGFAERRIEHMLDAVDASDGQREEIRTALEGLHESIETGRDARSDSHAAIAVALTGEEIDGEALEAIRAGHVERFEAMSQQMLQAIVRVAEVLTPEQRREITDQLEDHGHHRGRRGWY